MKINLNMKNILIISIISLVAISCSDECKDEDYIGEYKFINYNDCSEFFNKNNLSISLITPPKVGLIMTQQGNSMNIGMSRSPTKLEGWCPFSLNNIPDGDGSNLRIKGRIIEIYYRNDDKRCVTLTLERIK